MPDTFTTELSAVNAMLATIGESPVADLDDTSLLDVTDARSVLAEVSRTVLLDGWAFNTDDEYPLAPQTVSPFNILVPDTALVVIPSKSNPTIIVRAGKLFDNEAFSFNFEGKEPVPCRVVWSLPFADMPEVTRQYVTVRSCRLFQARKGGSETIYAFTDRDERDARLLHERNNIRVRRRNFLANVGSFR
jgi:hypothetical protein